MTNTFSVAVIDTKTFKPVTDKKEFQTYNEAFAGVLLTHTEMNLQDDFCAAIFDNEDNILDCVLFYDAVNGDKLRAQFGKQ